ncbi:MAG: response regulator [Microcoleus sp. PH2017_29_MFU_D_A]|jgi:CheY-like chemotaxis protein|uniref:response regulator n=1 Tax=unclassified Microcoleus TaxID=2642155 RepID=UPI001DF69C0E|nr:MULTISPECIES: response regulator [unclassified Microcoleus]MCC3420382.1 response regulator [Microcoleus sp. PH2017_07_MST_O_A]MCC3431690.1 response regulator [Microcoleus sp. PH2017_04_SCI_O_A]MCC3443221.1 response regulator [Microcoleus sp. PH2017_03_ELD_O_A]MCC3467583.1 response regulator [Microcoleus sp. PH2017_06_SFM_O_A]MCC3506140.1 response regulator [Microcoleus sp. PH2017_19_SFW_U_A]MCC3512058.1 response regulator [Microcoleus sp. PH2017_17_BER_D_A]TAE15842.1 MAG: response regulat
MSAKQILVIDDEQNLCSVIQACLEHLGGWRVLISPEASKGLVLAETQVPDAILLDVMMPDMDGVTLFGLLQKNATTREIPVIFLTAKVQAMDLNEFADLGVAGVIAKPFDPLSLAQQVAGILGWETLL